MKDLPIEFKNRLKNTLDDEYDSFIKSYDNPPLSGFRVNTLKLTPEDLHKLFPHSKGGVPWCPTGFYYDGGFGTDPCHRAGLFYSQEPSAMISAELLGVNEGDIVLDLCAAPGGKSTHIAAKLNGRGLLVANEIIHSRALILKENIQRMGIKNAVVTNMSPEDMEKEFEGFFDKILVDAPCSGEGMFRKNDEAIVMWSVEHTLACSQRQEHILNSAVKMLKPGGTIVYSTCTFAPCENEELIEKFLASHPDFSLEVQEHIYPHREMGEGHFAARLKHNGSGERKMRKPISSVSSKEFEKFKSDFLNTDFSGRNILFGDNLYLIPELFGDIKNIRVVLPGLHLGEIKKSRFEPSHHLCLSLEKDDFKIIYNADEKELTSYYSGNVINADTPSGWGAVLFNGFPTGWFKAANGQLKNHYPKKFRG